MKRTCILLIALLSAHFIVFPAIAGMDKAVGGAVHSITKAYKNIKSRQEEKKRIRIELESQFEMGHLLSGVRYTSTTNSPTGYVRVDGGAIYGIWKYLPEERRNELTENWNTSASALHDKVIKCYETIQNKDSVLGSSFTTFTNAYDKFISDVANLPKHGQDERHISLLRLDFDFKQMIDAGADIIHGTNGKGTGKDSMSIGSWISFSILGLWITYLLIEKAKTLVDKYSAKKLFNELSDKIDAYTVRNGFKKPEIEELGKESYIRFQTREPCSLAIAQGAKPDQEGRFQCSWVLKDPKDEDSRYICPPTDYQILFNPDTGTVEMLGLKN